MLVRLCADPTIVLISVLIVVIPLLCIPRVILGPLVTVLLIVISSVALLDISVNL